jgi:hypothetical protein
MEPPRNQLDYGYWSDSLREQIRTAAAADDWDLRFVSGMTLSNGGLSHFLWAGRCPQFTLGGRKQCATAKADDGPWRALLLRVDVLAEHDGMGRT